MDNVSETDARLATGSAKWPIVGAVLAAIGVCASCCLLPFALALFGIGGAWASGLHFLARYKPLFVLMAVCLLGYGFYAVYWKPKRACKTDGCETCRPSRTARLSLWIATVLAIASRAFDYLEPYL